MSISCTFDGINLPSTTSFEIYLLNTSSAKQKRRGERGSPCLTPLVQLKYPCDLPLIETDKKAD
jgi:hypothetical protein